jgi:hypothetical protein
MTTPPPPARALLDAVGAMKPVPTRRPGRTLATVTALLLLYAAIPLALKRLRPDLPYLPVPWLALVALAWLLGFALPLGAAFLPRRGQVLPDGARALGAALLAAAGLIAISLLTARDAPGHSWPSDGPLLLASVAHCLRFARPASIVPFGVALWFARRLAPVGSWRLGAALGAAAGALLGLVLHFLCPYSSALHVALGHGGAVVACGVLGALLAPRTVGRPHVRR